MPWLRYTGVGSPGCACMCHTCAVPDRLLQQTNSRTAEQRDSSGYTAVCTARHCTALHRKAQPRSWAPTHRACPAAQLAHASLQSHITEASAAIVPPTGYVHSLPLGLHTAMLMRAQVCVCGGGVGAAGATAPLTGAAAWQRTSSACSAVTCKYVCSCTAILSYASYALLPATAAAEPSAVLTPPLLPP